ncbi:AraC family transcriptional regulator [Zhouia sp. PK063]|uniref:AraC family transcriptional regulator n=1 Tax=Zhouia sp. PK063 TaxID=3373602 RepID=UPI00378DFB5A
MNTLKHHYSLRKLDTLVENRTVYSAAFAELNVYETYKTAEKVYLKFDFPIIASMISGKKVMHLKNKTAFDFFPGTSVVMPAHEKMIIDFPEASANNPTQCLALGIDAEKIDEAVMLFNNHTRIESENDDYTFTVDAIHLANEEVVQSLVNRLVTTFINGHKAKDVLIDLMIKELVIRLMQTKARLALMSTDNLLLDDNRMAFVVKYIREHLTDEINVEKLANKACMSKPNFFRIFKNTLGESPIEYLNSERIKFAKKLIQTTDAKLADIAFKSGFNNISYFNRQFKQIENMTPKQYKMALKKQLKKFQY